MFSPYKKPSLAQQANQLVLVMTSPVSTHRDRKAAAIQLRELKRTSKKSYSVLGLGRGALVVLNDLLAEEPAQPKVRTSAKTRAMTEALKRPQANI